ncbi:hypothetical protein EMIT0P260_20089 [Pseudomonas sp. IT-P260]
MYARDPVGAGLLAKACDLTARILNVKKQIKRSQPRSTRQLLQDRRMSLALHISTATLISIDLRHQTARRLFTYRP